MLDLRRIGLFTRDNEQDYRLGSLRKLFSRAGIELVDDAGAMDAGALDLVIALGGDGTVLRALAACPGTPVLAVNFGQVGFLTQADREHMDRVLVRLLSDDYRIEERLTLSVTHRGQTVRAINEVVIKGVSHMVELQVAINGRTVHEPRGDGIIVGTPTGSTAYLLSTGAPIVTPDVDCILVKPLNEYSLAQRSIIVPGSAHVTLKVQPGREDDIGLVVDGGPRIRVEAGDIIDIGRSPVPARLVYFDDDYFFRNLRERLRW
ncbi:MAG: NAD(+)/NADH kinase [Myxococcales bacterium]|nr:NAD(+)/NADH kinase [Myxococcales bacterium]MCB9523980.1 NAD(+)/NADH kinase [Myxococcales bacterium]